jgi:hypothetical protein
MSGKKTGLIFIYKSILVEIVVNMIYNNILNSLENKEANCFVFCDFSKAFDKVWHQSLLHKMKAYGIPGNLIDWFSSYL